MQQAAVSAVEGEIDLLGFMNDTVTPTAPPSSLILNPKASITGERYQQIWGSQPDASAASVVIPLKFTPQMSDVEAAFTQAHVLTMASGELPTELKLFCSHKNLKVVLPFFCRP